MARRADEVVVSASGPLHLDGHFVSLASSQRVGAKSRRSRGQEVARASPRPGTARVTLVSHGHPAQEEATWTTFVMAGCSKSALLPLSRRFRLTMENNEKWIKYKEENEWLCSCVEYCLAHSQVIAVTVIYFKYLFTFLICVFFPKLESYFRVILSLFLYIFICFIYIYKIYTDIYVFKVWHFLGIFAFY